MPDPQNGPAYTIDNGSISADGKNLSELCRDFATPCFVYNLRHVRSRARELRRILTGGLGQPPSIHYAMKANARPSILRVLAKLRLSVDVVSGGEIQTALENRFSASDILFSGVGKTRRELLQAIQLGVKQINVESLSEIERIIDLAERANVTEPISIGLRFNPNISPETHPYITTGLRENKFGLEDDAVLAAVDRIARKNSTRQLIAVRGLSLHIGSQLLDLAPLEEAIAKALSLQDRIASTTQGKAAGPWDRFDAGGGIGIDYSSGDEQSEYRSITALAEIFSQQVRKRIESGSLADVMVEPGRWLVGRSGLLISEVQYIKTTSHKTFVVVDAGMNNLIRPALYSAEHRIQPLDSDPESARHHVDIVGPICESSDVLGSDRALPALREGDRIAVFDVGAYGRSMSSNYNLRGWPEEYDLYA